MVGRGGGEGIPLLLWATPGWVWISVGGLRAQGPCLALVAAWAAVAWAVACGVRSQFSTPLSKQWMTVSESAEFLAIGEDSTFQLIWNQICGKPRAGPRVSFLAPENLKEHRNTFLFFFWKWKENRKYSYGTFLNLVSSIDPFKRKKSFFIVPSIMNLHY